MQTAAHRLENKRFQVPETDRTLLSNWFLEQKQLEEEVRQEIVHLHPDKIQELLFEIAKTALPGKY